MSLHSICGLPIVGNSSGWVLAVVTTGSLCKPPVRGLVVRVAPWTFSVADIIQGSSLKFSPEAQLMLDALATFCVPSGDGNLTCRNGWCKASLLVSEASLKDQSDWCDLQSQRMLL